MGAPDAIAEGNPTGGVAAARRVKLSVVIPCYSEENTLEACVERVLAIADDTLELELIIVDDGSQDGSGEIANQLGARHSNLVVLRHDANQGKGAALRTGITRATGDFVAVQDADLEYDPNDLRRLLIPLRKGEADVVLGSRFLSHEYHRVLYFWHSMGNRLLTLLSNMLSDLNLTDMECCYKVFRRDVIQAISLQENGFGFEPEVVAKIAHLRLRIYEMGISYRGRTYSEGKKIRAKDGIRALYCVLKYNLHHAPWIVQFAFYTLIGGICAVLNLVLFLLLLPRVGMTVAAPAAFFLAALANYYLCVLVLFRRRARWGSTAEVLVFLVVVAVVGVADLFMTRAGVAIGLSAASSKICATAIGLFLNFAGRRVIVFPERPSPDWKPQNPS
jgi:glycosyltransferase involved in cell wall biosynthesis